MSQHKDLNVGGTYCKSDNEHKEHQKDNMKMLKKNFMIIECGEGK